MSFNIVHIIVRIRRMDQQLVYDISARLKVRREVLG